MDNYWCRYGADGSAANFEQVLSVLHCFPAQEGFFFSSFFGSCPWGLAWVLAANRKNLTGPGDVDIYYHR